MELGAVVVVPNKIEVATSTMAGLNLATPDFPRPAYSPRTPILGNDALQLWVDRVRTLGVENIWLASGSQDGHSLWARFGDLARQGIEKLFVIKLKSYAEMDLSDLLRFHCEKRNPVTDARDARGPLGVRLLNSSVLNSPAERDNPCRPVSESAATHYQFCGYTKRLLSSPERQDLVRDALNGQCAMRPAGRLVRDQVWIAEGAVVDESARIIGPVYVGPRTVVHAGSTIGPFTSVERDCVVDCGTTVERSSVLPGTYLAPGLLIQQSLVDGNLLEHLGWQTMVDLAPARLAHAISCRASFKSESPHADVTKKHSPESGHAAEWQASFPSTSPTSSWIRVQL